MKGSKNDLRQRLWFRTNQGSFGSSNLLFHTLNVSPIPRVPSADGAVMRS